MNRRCVWTIASPLRSSSVFGVVLFGVLVTLGPAGCERAPDDQMLRKLITARTLGLAYLEESKLDEAEVEFRFALEVTDEAARAELSQGRV